MSAQPRTPPHPPPPSPPAVAAVGEQRFRLLPLAEDRIGQVACRPRARAAPGDAAARRCNGD
eukprot:8539162-Pyramimonas_sp.AAC.1